MRALFREQRRNRRRWGDRQRDFDEDQRLVDQPRMEERVASPVGRIDAPPEFVPVADFVHRLVADDLFQKRRWRGPVDATQHQKPAIEPRTEQMQKIAIDNGERRVLLHELEQVSAHRDQRRGAAGRAIDPPEQLVTTRLGGVVDFARRRFVAIRLELGDRVPHPIAIGPEIVGECDEERSMIARIERAIAPDDLGGERDLPTPRPALRPKPGNPRPIVRRFYPHPSARA